MCGSDCRQWSQRNNYARFQFAARKAAILGGHELGHWMYDRGKASFSCEERQFIQDWSRNNPESCANRYASDLLLPIPIFKPLTANLRVINMTAAGRTREEVSDELNGYRHPAGRAWPITSDARLLQLERAGMVRKES